MKRIDDLRKVWPNEATNFTKWLAEEENLEELGKAVLALKSTWRVQNLMNWTQEPCN
ncbi:MAG: hypothetical protein IJJ72_04325 [Bacteroidales bacterium]|nr:hypothetical protein [Bacteroidales bacterium]